jgi:hypothetical protein
MRYVITGADGATGKEQNLIVEALDEREAVTKARQGGVMPYKVVREKTEEAGAAPVATTMPPPAVGRAALSVGSNVFASVSRWLRRNPMQHTVVGILIITMVVWVVVEIQRGNENLLTFVLFILAIVVLFIIFEIIARNLNLQDRKLSKMPPIEREKYLAAKRGRQEELQWGPINPAMICPHCQSKECVRTKRIVQKKGVSGSKATGALLTGGLSVLATGLSRKEGATQAYCSRCTNQWVF